jgi:peptide/nickel transport system permease protein
LELAAELNKYGEAVVSTQESQVARTWRRFRRNKLGMVGLITLILILVAVFAVPILSPFPYAAQNAFQALAPAGTVSVQAGLDTKAGYVYWLGTDDLGRDMLTRLTYGGRITLLAALLTTVLVMIVGSAIGGIAGFYGGAVDGSISRVTDFMLAFPLLPTFLLLTKVFPIGAHYSGQGPGSSMEDWFQTAEQAFETAWNYALIFLILGWMPLSRQVRATVLTLRSLDFVEASRALGAGSRHIIWKHLIPNAAGPIVIAAVLLVGEFIIYETVLSYLGMGVGKPVPSWGNLIKDAQAHIWSITNTINPTEDIRGFLLLMPGILILVTVLSINLVGNALRDIFSHR